MVQELYDKGVVRNMSCMVRMVQELYGPYGRYGEFYCRYIPGRSCVLGVL